MASGTLSGRSRSRLFTTRTSATTRPLCSYTVGMSSGCLARWKRCWGGSSGPATIGTGSLGAPDVAGEAAGRGPQGALGYQMHLIAPATFGLEEETEAQVRDLIACVLVPEV